VQRHAGRNWLTRHHLGDGGQDARVILGVVDMMDVERLGDVAKAHVRGPHIDQLALGLSDHRLGIDIIGDHRALRPEHHDDPRLFKSGLDLLGIRGTTLQRMVPPHRPGTVLLLNHARERASQITMLRRVADENRLHGDPRFYDFEIA